MATPVLLNLRINRKCHFQMNASYKTTSSENMEKNRPEYRSLSSILTTAKNSIWFIILLLVVSISWVWREKWLSDRCSLCIFKVTVGLFECDTVHLLFLCVESSKITVQYLTGHFVTWGNLQCESFNVLQMLEMPF